MEPDHGGPKGRPGRRDRKSTRLNSSHSQISYAVFCLKKENKWTKRNGLHSICLRRSRTCARSIEVDCQIVTKSRNESCASFFFKWREPTANKPFSPQKPYRR